MKAVSSIVFAVLALIVCGAAEELLPKIASTGFPFLLCAALWNAVSCKKADGIVFAIAAGAAEDALCLLPTPTAATYFPLAAVVCMRMDVSLPFPAIAAAAWGTFQLWLWIWLGDIMGGAVHLRFAVALPMATAAAIATEFLAVLGVKKAGLAT